MGFFNFFYSKLDKGLANCLLPILFVFLLITAYGMADLLGFFTGKSGELLSLQPNQWMYVAYGVIYLSAMMICFIKLWVLKPMPLSGLALWLLVGLAFLSIFWSIEPVVSAKRVFALVGMAALASLVVYYMPLERYMSLMTMVAVTVVVATLIGIALLPELTVHKDGSHLGRWKGFFRHKNTLANFLVFALPFLFGYWFVKGRTLSKSIFIAAVIVLLLIVLIKAESATSWVMLLAGCLGAGLALVLHYTRVKVWQLGLIAVLICVAGYVFKDLIFDFLGRSATLTGRTVIWSDLVPFIHDKWMGGYGYMAFWEAIRQGELEAESGWIRNVRFSHNGYLEVLLSLGVAGLLLFLGSLVLWVRRLFTNRYSLSATVCAFTYLGIFVIHNLAESSILQYGSLHWFNFCVLFFYVVPQWQCVDGAESNVSA